MLGGSAIALAVGWIVAQIRARIEPRRKPSEARGVSECTPHGHEKYRDRWTFRFERRLRATCSWGRLGRGAQPPSECPSPLYSRMRVPRPTLPSPCPSPPPGARGSERLPLPRRVRGAG